MASIGGYQIKFGQSKSGLYFRNLGKLAKGGQPKFYLGRDHTTALIRAARLEQVWAGVVSMAESEDRPAVWDAVSLAVADSVKDGKPIAQIDLGKDGPLAAWAIDELRQVWPFIRLELKDQETAKDGESYWRDEGRKLIDQGREWVQKSGNQKLHEALTAYTEHVRNKCREVGGQVSDWGEAQCREVSFLIKHLPDIRLADLDTRTAEGLLDIIRLRPASDAPGRRNGQPISPKSAKNYIKAVRAFLRWLHRSPDWQWKRPEDWELGAVKVPLTNEERANRYKSEQVATYSLDEIETLWKYATPPERVYMVLALNCSMGRGELASLRLDEIKLRTRHPSDTVLEFTSTDSDSWIFRTRRKTGVYGEWRLWAETVKAIEWAKANRPESSEPYLLLSDKGRPIVNRTTGGRQNSTIANAWKRLTDRVRKDHKDFPIHSFNKLRKTAGNRVRLEGGAEVSSSFIAHGSSAEDTLLDVYTNRPFAKVFDVLWSLEKRLFAPIFATVPDSFPEVVKKGGANITPGQIRQVQQLRRQGKRIADIARETGLSRETVRRWVKRDQKQPA